LTVHLAWTTVPSENALKVRFCATLSRGLNRGSDVCRPSG
jgi:hypothetical protein